MALDPVSAALDIGGKIIDRIWPDPAQAAAAKLELLKMEKNGELTLMTAQTEINKVEAAHNSIFVAGWRPFIGWVCGMTFAFKFILGPLAAVVMAVAGKPIVLPVLDTTEMMPLLVALLGLGAYRTYEKKNGVA